MNGVSSKGISPGSSGKYAKNLRKYVPPIVAFLVTVSLWQIGVKLLDIPAFVLPQPLAIAVRFVEEIPTILPAALVTITEAAGGFLIGFIVAVTLAVLFVRFQWLERSLYPYALAAQTIPIVAIAPLMIIWFGFGMLSKIMIASLLTFFPILVNMNDGLRSLHPEALDLLRSYGATETQIFTRLRIRSSLPLLFTGMKIAATGSVIGAVVAEFVGAWEGVGYLITRASYYMDAELTFAVVLASSMTAIIFFGAVSLLERAVVFWRKKL